MEVHIRIFGQEIIFLEIEFVNIDSLNYQVVIDPPIMLSEKMTEEEVRNFENREYRFLSLNHKDFEILVKNKCKLKVVAEDVEGRTFYSNILELNNAELG